MNNSKRVLLAGLFHETHTFLEGTTGLRDFHVLRGRELLACAGNASPLGGVVESAAQFGWTVLPVIDYRATPGPMVEDAVIESFWAEFKEAAQAHLRVGVDAIFLVLHGAMVSQSLTDVEGEMLERMRSVPGLERAPLFGVFDLHANFSERMARLADGLIAYRENPHTDARPAAQAAAALLERCLTTGKVPKIHWEHPPIIWPPTGTGTADEPMRSLEKLAREIEAGSEEIQAVNVVAGFSFADVPETGVSFSIVTTGAEAVAREQLARLGRLALEMAEQGNRTEPPVESILENILPLPPGLTLLVEPSDNIGGGAPGDGTGLLRALVAHRVRNAAVAINDPESVQRLQAVSPGARLRLAIGGKGSRLDPGPCELEVELISKGDGKFELEDKQSHLASMSGDAFDMGSCAVVRHEGLLILLTSHKTAPFDLGQWRSQGIEPSKLSLIGVKAAVAHRRAYDPIAARSYWVGTAGPCTSDLKALPYCRVRRPIFPLDPLPGN